MECFLLTKTGARPFLAALAVTTFIFIPWRAAAVSPPSPELSAAAAKWERVLDIPREDYGPVAKNATGGELLVLLCDTDDRPADRTVNSRERWNDLFFAPRRSVAAHWEEATRGRVVFRGSAAEWIRLDGRYDDYRSDLSLFAAHAFAALAGTVDWSRYDWDGDGLAEGVVIVHAGRGGEETGSTGDIWSQARRFASPPGGFPVEAAAFVPEDGRLGVCAHETGHLLGLPDLYDRSLRSMGLGIWSLMAYGTWAGGGDSPTGLDAWSLFALGLGGEAPGSDENGVWTMHLFGDSPGPVRIVTAADRRESFLLGWRRRAGVDSLLPGGGLEIYHINDRYRGNSAPDHYHVALEQADGLFDLERSSDFRGWGDDGDLYPGSTGNVAFTASTLPSSRLSGGLRSGIALDIDTFTAAEGVTITGTAQAPLAPELEVQSVHILDGGETDRLVTGRRCVVEVTVQNRGNAVSPPREVTALAEETFLSVPSGRALLPELAVGEWSTAENSPRFKMVVDSTKTGPGAVHVVLSPDSIWLGDPARLEIGFLPPERPGWPVAVTEGWGVGEPSFLTAAGDTAGALLTGDLAGRLFRIGEDGRREILADVGGPPAGRCAVADIDGDGAEEIALLTEKGTLYLLGSDGSVFAGWPVSLDTPVPGGPLLMEEVDRSWSVVVSAGTALHRFDRGGAERDGWPVRFGSEITVPVLFVNRREDGVVVIDGEGAAHLLSPAGVERNGWPVPLGSPGVSAPVVAMFGSITLVVACEDGTIHGLRWDGTPAPGWPVDTGEPSFGTALAVADVDGDGYDEVAVAPSHSCTLLDRGGVPLAGWPVSTLPGRKSALLLADVAGDDRFEVIAGNRDAGWYGWDSRGRPLAGWPVPAEGFAGVSALADLDGDGTWEIYADDSARGWRAFDLAGGIRKRPAWTLSRGDAAATGNLPAPAGGLPDLEVIFPEPGISDERLWAGDPVRIPFLIVNRGVGESAATLLRTSWRTGSSGGAAAVDSMVVTAILPGDTVRVDLDSRVPYAEDEGTVFEARLDRSGSETALENNTAVVSIGKTVPGDRLEFSGYGIAPTEIALCDGMLYQVVAGFVLPRELRTGTDRNDLVVAGHDLSVSVNDFFVISGNRVERVDLHSGMKEFLTGSSNLPCCPSAGNEVSIWTESQCGGRSSIAVFHRSTGRIDYMPCRNQPVGKPAAAGGVAYWAESDGDGSALLSANLDTGTVREIYSTSDRIGLLAADSSGALFALSPAGGTSLLFYDGVAGSVRLLARRDGAIESIAMAKGLAVWSERMGGEADLFAMEIEGERIYPICLAAGDQGSVSLSGDTIVWIDARTAPAVARGMHVERDLFDDRSMGGEEGAGKPQFTVRFLRAEVLGDSVRLDWRVVGEVSEGVFKLLRTGAGISRADLADSIAAGRIQGEGFYSFVDHLAPDRKRPEFLYYYIEANVGKTRITAGPLAVRPPAVPVSWVVEPPYPNPASKTVRLAFSVPSFVVLPEKRETILEVFDIRGRRVRKERFGVVGRGRRSVEWDLLDGSGRDVRSGLYFLRLAVGDRRFPARKVLVVRR